MVGFKLKKIRTDKGLTQGELGKKAGVSYIQIGRYEKNASMPSSKVIKKLADALEVETDFFFNVEGPKVDITDLDKNYKTLRDLINDDNSEMQTFNVLMETFIFKNNARRQFSKS